MWNERGSGWTDVIRGVIIAEMGMESWEEVEGLVGRPPSIEWPLEWDRKVEREGGRNEVREVDR